VALDGRDIPTHRLADALWPDADGDHADQALATALHRLRRLLGEGSVETHGGCVTLSRQFCWCDVWAFEASLRRSETAARCGQGGEAARFKARARDLYRGPFLPGVDEEWASPLRERLRRQREGLKGLPNP
jgi:DNA-binding SARP family transcriptional activator